MSPRVPMSLEGLRHLYAAHPCEDWTEVPFRCPCGSSALILCSGCGTRLVLFIRPGTWCPHAAAVWKAA
jgi:hypothetical protein